MFIGPDDLRSSRDTVDGSTPPGGAAVLDIDALRAIPSVSVCFRPHEDKHITTIGVNSPLRALCIYLTSADRSSRCACLPMYSGQTLDSDGQHGQLVTLSPYLRRCRLSRLYEASWVPVRVMAVVATKRYMC